MAVSSDYLQFILEQLHGLGQVHARRMFGAAGLYCDEIFFGIISDDTLYLRVDEASRPDYTSRGMQAFRPYADRPEVSMTYFEVPADVLEDAAELLTWSRRALASRVAGAAAVKTKRRRPGRLKRLR
ncbi:MAG TPA: TfoX/Sxy family protein [Steroidobacteraceae bacterium]|jgi:DNA transformation protein|nr:TfoX/Sxy family protein [Steroidobacteraceae bacterium]